MIDSIIKPACAALMALSTSLGGALADSQTLRCRTFDPRTGEILTVITDFDASAAGAVPRGRVEIKGSFLAMPIDRSFPASEFKLEIGRDQDGISRLALRKKSSQSGFLFWVFRENRESDFVELDFPPLADQPALLGRLIGRAPGSPEGRLPPSERITADCKISPKDPEPLTN